MSFVQKPDRWTRAVARAIGLVSPGLAYKFARRRMALRGYMAGEPGGANKRWRPSNKSADELIKADHKMVTARARDLARNSPVIKGALKRVRNNVVFQGIKPQVMFRRPTGEMDMDAAKAIESLYKAWAKAVDWHEGQGLVLNHQWTDGEALIHWVPDPDLFRQGVPPIRPMLIECDQLDVSVDGRLQNGNRAVRGIELNAYGVPVAYHLLDEHPGDYGSYAVHDSRRIEARWITHVFQRERISQHRGMAWLDAVIMTMRNLDEYQHSERLAARLASALGVFVHTDSPELIDGGNPLGGQVPGQSLDTTDAGELPEYMGMGEEAARIYTLPNGTRVEVAANPRPGASYEPFTKSTKRDVSAGIGMSYEAISNDYTDASYSSARSATLEERRGYKVMQHFLITRMLEPGWEMFKMYANVFGLAAIGLEAQVNWQAPGWTWVDPDKDSKAAARDVKELHVNTRRNICAERGLDLDEVLDQLEYEAEEIRRRKIIEDEEAEDALPAQRQE